MMERAGVRERRGGSLVREGGRGVGLPKHKIYAVAVDSTTREVGGGGSEGPPGSKSPRPRVQKQQQQRRRRQDGSLTTPTKQHSNNNYNNNNNNNKTTIMESVQKVKEGQQVEELRRENEEVKDRLSNLQREFSVLEEQVKVLAAERVAVEEQQRAEKEAVERAYTSKLQQYQATLAALDTGTTASLTPPPQNPPKISEVDGVVAETMNLSGEGVVKKETCDDGGDSNGCTVVQVLAERCRTLESANKRLQDEARTQQRQYEVCLDRVATQVVQALLSQKSHQEQCIKLAHQVKDLRRQNAALSSLVGSPGNHPQTLPCHHRHRCHHPGGPMPPPSSQTPPPPHPQPFLSLPTSLTKNKQHGEAWPGGGWLASWRMEEGSQSHLGDHHHHHSSDTSIPTSLSLNTTTSSVQLGEDCYTPHHHNHHQQQNHSSTTTTVTSANTSANTSTTTCWYDIVSSPQGPTSTQDPNWDHRTSTSSTISSESPVQSTFPQPDLFSRDGDVTCRELVCEGVGMSPPTSSDSPASKFSPLSLESASTSNTSSPEQKTCQSLQAKIDNLEYGENQFKVLQEGEQLLNSSGERNANILVGAVTRADLSNILEVKERLMKSLTEGNPGNLQIDLSVLCEEKSKGVLNKNLSKLGVRGAIEGEEVAEGATKDEGYSTMSSDVQAEVKENVNTRPVTTVQEEPVPTPTPPPPNHSTPTPPPTHKSTPTSTLHTGTTPTPPSTLLTRTTHTATHMDCTHPPPPDIMQSSTTQHQQKTKESEMVCQSGSVESGSRITEGNVVKERKVSSTANAEYCDGLRVIYDEEDNNSDVFFIPIQEPENESLYRHSYHVNASVEKSKPVRCYSDSHLYLGRKNAHSGKPQRSLDRHVSEKEFNERSPSTEEVLEEANNTRSLKRTNIQASLKKKYKYTKDDIGTSGSSEDLWPSVESERKYLSPTYSQAELEDWSLNLSSEYLSGVCGEVEEGGEGEGSESVATSEAHHGSLPSIQEATPDLEEDTNEFLWNGATYFKADLDLDWSSKKELTKSWQMDHCKDNHIVSPRSGCSDQPAVWSSSEQLSCCSEGVSKCSSDFENFCEQLCNLPELKRVSFCSSEAGGGAGGGGGGGGGVVEAGRGAVQDISSAEEHEEELDDVCVDTVFTRDFYRLVKFESNKSLAASSISLATSEGLLTLEKLQDLESGGTHKEALASVLGFIAEQRKYCKEREAQDEEDSRSTSDMLKLANVLENSGVIFRGTFPKRSPRETSSSAVNTADDFSMRTLPSFNSGDCTKIKVGPPVPPKPRSSLQHEVSKDSCSNVPAANCSLPATSPPSYPVLSPSPKPMPFVPSRSSSLAHAAQVPPVDDDVDMPPPPPPLPEVLVGRTSQYFGTNPDLEDTTSCAPSDFYDLPPPVPERSCSNVPTLPHPAIPRIPHRSSSMALCNLLPVPEHKVNLNESPPLPKRITSRALPQPPPVPLNQVPKQHNGSSKPLGGSLEGKRRSFIKETLGLSPRRPQSDYCELPSLSENPAGMLKQLQVMAQVEEEEERRRKWRGVGGVMPPPTVTTTDAAATSPGDTAGLGTGWVRVQPHVDLQDPQARANLLDGMMESSEGCSSETEDESVGNQYAHLRSIHRSRRKRKASHRNGGERIILNSGPPRPSILGRRDLFSRFGQQEMDALQEFEFLGNLSTSHSDLGSQDLCSNPTTTNSSTILITTNAAFSRLPAMSAASQLHTPASSSFSLLHTYANTSLCTPVATSLDTSATTAAFHTSTTNSFHTPVTASFHTSASTSLHTSANTSLHTPTPNLHQLSRTGALPKTTSEIYKKPVKQADKRTLKRGKSESAKYCGPIVSGHEGGVDTSSICSVKNTIRQLNKINHISGIKEPATNTTNPVRSASSPSSTRLHLKTSSPVSTKKQRAGTPLKLKCNEENLTGTSKTSRQGSSPASRTPSPQLSAKDNNKGSVMIKSSSSLQYSDEKSAGTNTKTGSPTRIPRIQTSHMSSNKKSRAESPKLQKDSEAFPKPKTQSEKALPPKGFSSRVTKGSPRTRSSPPHRHQSPQSNKSGIRSPRLARVRKAVDPLESFTNKSLCDSGSSEGSERWGGRLSLSDSCAENFSPIDSGDEVFYKEC